MKLNRIKIVTLLASALITSSAVYAEGSDAVLDLLVKKGIITQREANEVHDQLDQQTAQNVELYNKTKVGSWLDALVFSSDLRLRGEYFDFEKNPATGIKLGGDRLRFRYRLRFGMEAQYHDWATVNFRLASGDGDPVSVNQTFTDTFRKKPINIDVASVTLMYPGCDMFKVIAGKMDIPIWQPKFNSPMVYDFDVTPEGVAEQIQFKLGQEQRYRIFANAGQFAAKEVSGDANDTYLFDQQAGFEAKIGGEPKTPAVKMTAVGGMFLTTNLKQLKNGDSPNTGNSLASGATTTNNLANFNVLYARGEIAWNISPKPFLGTPAVVTLSGEYDKNVKNAFENVPNDQTDGWTGQIAFGEAKKKGQWQIAYQYKRLEADAVWDAVTDSDWGSGGTDRQGHVVKATFNPQDWWQLGFTAFVTEKISNRPNSGHNTRGFNGEDLLRIQADTVFKF